jgi:2-iminoacetate synthase
MEFAIPGFIKDFCTPNALLTLEEYLEDYSTEETRKLGQAVIEKELDQMGDSGLRNKTGDGLRSIRSNGKRDISF